MYTFLWRHLPGSTGARILQVLALLALVFWVLMTWAFPALEPHLPLEEVMVG